MLIDTEIGVRQVIELLHFKVRVLFPVDTEGAGLKGG